MATSAKKKTPAELLGRLESRHDDLLNQLDELNGQIERALREVTGEEDSLS